VIRPQKPDNRLQRMSLRAAAGPERWSDDRGPGSPHDGVLDTPSPPSLTLVSPTNFRSS